MKPGFHVCLYKRMGNPIITAFVTGDGKEGEISMPLGDFKEKLIEEIGSVTWIMKNKTFEERVDQAFENVISGMKKGATTIV